MLNELNLSKPEGLVAKKAEALLQRSFDRVSGHLDWVFESNVDGLWDYISMLSLVEKWDINGRKNVDYQDIHYPEEINFAYEEDFQKALESRNYDVLSDILIDTSFACYYTKRFPACAAQLPKTGFVEYIDKIVSLDPTHKWTTVVQGYSDQNYYIAHVVFVLSDYGEMPLLDTRLARKVKEYLLAEFVHCLKMFGEGRCPEVQEAIRFLLTKQDSDGS